MEEFSGRVAVITGGASGIGLAMARRFGAEGMRLVLADIEERALLRAVTQLSEAGIEVIGVPTDVADHGAVRELHARTLEEFGSVHLVCNNAGVVGTSIVETPIEVWRWVLGVNLHGVINGCNVFLPTLVEQGEGHVVNTASLAGLRGIGTLGVYSTTKFGVVGLSESLHEELRARGSAVGVSVVCPGFVQTRIGEYDRNMPEELRAARRQRDAEAATVAMVKTGIPAEQVADAVFDGVRAGHLYVLTHEEMARGAMEQRLAMMFGEP